MIEELIGGFIFAIVVYIFSLRKELRLRNEELEFRNGEIELLRHNLNTLSVKYQEEVRENLEVKKFIERERYRKKK